MDVEIQNLKAINNQLMHKIHYLNNEKLKFENEKLKAEIENEKLNDKLLYLYTTLKNNNLLKYVS
jgi:glutathione synthase/RimK-type ligase-like ATP-grasp enzyme